MKISLRKIALISAAAFAFTQISANAQQQNQATFSDTEIQNLDTENPIDNQVEFEDDFFFGGSLIQLDEEGLEEMAEYDFEEIDDALAQDIIEYAKNFLGRPYVYGSVGPKTFDCSGFTSYVFRKYGVTLSRTSRQQATQGVKVSTKDVQPGDLLFFSGRGGGSTVGHVAMAVDVDENGVIKFIHASCSKGISYATYPDGGYYSKRFLGARRVLEQ